MFLACSFCHDNCFQWFVSSSLFYEHVMPMFILLLVISIRFCKKVQLRYFLLRLRHVTVPSLQRYSACRKSNLQPWRFRSTIVAFWTWVRRSSLIATTTVTNYLNYCKEFNRHVENISHIESGEFNNILRSFKTKTSFG